MSHLEGETGDRLIRPETSAKGREAQPFAADVKKDQLHPLETQLADPAENLRDESCTVSPRTVEIVKMVATLNRDSLEGVFRFLSPVEAIAVYDVAGVLRWDGFRAETFRTGKYGGTGARATLEAIGLPDHIRRRLQGSHIYYIDELKLILRERIKIRGIGPKKLSEIIRATGPFMETDSG